MQIPDFLIKKFPSLLGLPLKKRDNYAMIIKLGYDAGDRCPLLSANF